MEKYQFKPFDKVLIRNYDNSEWQCDIYSHKTPNGYVCIGSTYRQCIPYNEKTAHLIGTNEPYKKPEPKEYHVWTSGTFNEWFTKTEFENFIKTAVIHNKDITDFHVLRIKQ